jgi:hypothetical protein
VVRFVNFYQDNGFGKAATPGYGFNGELVNIDLTPDTSIGHGNIGEIFRDCSSRWSTRSSRSRRSKPSARRRASGR